MNSFKILFTICLSFTFASLFAQSSNEESALLFTLRPMPDQSWAVFVKPDTNIEPSDRIATGSGQVTLVAPLDFTYTNFKSHGGTWIENARVDGPTEATEATYISFGFVTDNPKINLISNQETLLFTFTTDKRFDGTFSLIENEMDPFTAPNSFQSNPGNDLGVIDFGANGGMQYYAYAGNYESTPQAVFASQKNTKKGRKSNQKGQTIETAPK